MTGLIIFTLILLFYGIFLSYGLWLPLIPNIDFKERVRQLTEDMKSRVSMSVIAVVAGMWNLFAPDFGAMNSPTILGAFIPSLILIFDGLVLCPELVNLLNITDESKKKYIERVSRSRRAAGPVTIAVAILHIIFFRSLFF